MRSLLWKEFHEKWYWFLMVLGIYIPVMTGDGFVFAYSISTTSMQYSVLICLIYGLTAYSGDLSQKTLKFLLTRHVSWKQVLAAKLIVNIGIIATADMVGYIIFRLLLPVEYHAPGSVPSFFDSYGWALLVTAGPYLVGAMCSTVLPGITGSAVVATAIITLFLAQRSWFGGIYGYTERLVQLVWIIGAGIASFCIIRFGIASSTRYRVVRFCSILVVIGVINTLLIYSLRTTSTFDIFTGRKVSISPDGQYALQITHGSPMLHYYIKSELTRLSDGKSVVISDDPVSRDSSIGQSCWTDSGKICYLQGCDLIIADIDKSGHINKETVTLETFRVASLMPSPDSHSVIIEESFDSANVSPILVFVDIEKRCRFSTYVTDYKKYWWQTNDEIGYIDNQSKRHIVKLGIG